MIDLRNPNEIMIEHETLANITLVEALERHRLYLNDKDGGAQLDVIEGDLSRADLRDIDLSEAILIGANLNAANLSGANLSKTILHAASLIFADLHETNLHIADLSGINLFRAKVTGEQLSQAKRLYRATMPDGGRYDGRFNLESDIELAREEGIDPGDADAMADWYAN